MPDHRYGEADAGKPHRMTGSPRRQSPSLLERLTDVPGAHPWARRIGGLVPEEMSHIVRSGGTASVLIAGGGVAALEAALALRALGEERVSVELISPEPLFWYRPLAVAEPFRLGEVMHFELPELAAAAGATFSLGTLVSVDPTHHLAHISPGGAIPYDMLLIACGPSPSRRFPAR
jgi:NADPH-dependent 2,4-dienoyl-CoA reductase/sulfur reductase-like enzyme